MAYKCKSNRFELFIKLYKYLFILYLFIEKRLAMELISRTMQDMQNNEIDPFSDNSASDLSTITTASATNLNKYWCLLLNFFYN